MHLICHILATVICRTIYREMIDFQGWFVALLDTMINAHFSCSNSMLLKHTINILKLYITWDIVQPQDYFRCRKYKTQIILTTTELFWENIAYFLPPIFLESYCTSFTFFSCSLSFRYRPLSYFSRVLCFSLLYISVTHISHCCELLKLVRHSSILVRPFLLSCLLSFLSFPKVKCDIQKLSIYASLVYLKFGN